MELIAAILFGMILTGLIVSRLTRQAREDFKNVVRNDRIYRLTKWE